MAVGLQATMLAKYKNESMDMVRGTAYIFPDPNVITGNIYNLAGLGNFFSGNYFVVSVTQDFSSGQYQMYFEGIKQKWNGSALFYSHSSSTGNSKPNPRPPRTVKKTTTKTKYHIVAPNETLMGIAEKYYGSSSKWTVIEKANHDYLVKIDPRNESQLGHWIYPAMKLLIP